MLMLACMLSLLAEAQKQKRLAQQPVTADQRPDWMSEGQITTFFTGIQWPVRHYLAFVIGYFAEKEKKKFAGQLFSLSNEMEP